MEETWPVRRKEEHHCDGEKEGGNVYRDRARGYAFGRVTALT